MRYNFHKNASVVNKRCPARWTDITFRLRWVWLCSLRRGRPVRWHGEARTQRSGWKQCPSLSTSICWACWTGRLQVAGDNSKTDPVCESTRPRAPSSMISRYHRWCCFRAAGIQVCQSVYKDLPLPAYKYYLKMYLFESFGEYIWQRMGDNNMMESEQSRVQKWITLQNEGLCEGNKILIQSLLAGECRFKVACGNKSPKGKKTP